MCWPPNLSQRCTAREVFHEELQEVELAERENKRRREEEEAKDRQEQLYKVGGSTDSGSDCVDTKLFDCRQHTWMGYRAVCSLKLCLWRTQTQCTSGRCQTLLRCLASESH